MRPLTDREKRTVRIATLGIAIYLTIFFGARSWESPARPSAKELASIQLEISGQVQAVITLLHRLDTLGYPLIIDSVQINSGAGRQSGPAGGRTGPMEPTGAPGMVKISLTIVILDYDPWKNEEKRNV